MSATEPKPQPEGPLSEAELVELECLEGQATAAPWWYDEDDLYYRLHGTAGWSPRIAALDLPPQAINHQIFKAPKKSEVFEPYWPPPADAQMIPLMRNALPRLLEELRSLRELVLGCSCADGAPGDYEGPRADCPVHGAVQALRQVQEENRALKGRMRELEEWIERRPSVQPVLIPQDDPKLVEDGFGGAWTPCKPDCDLHVVRPGKVQCPCEDGDG